MILSNRKLKLIIITLLLLIFCFFLGMFKPKALNVYGLTFYQSICPDGSSYTDGDWRGCNNTRSNVADNYFQFRNDGNIIPDGYYDLSFSLKIREDTNITASVKDVACAVYGTDMSYNGYSATGKFYNIKCENVPITSGITQLFITSYTNFSGNNQGSSDRRVSVLIYNSVIEHQHATSAEQNIANNTNDIKNSINDSNVDNNATSSSSTSWNNKNATNSTITNLLTLPISLLTNIVNGIQTSCSSFSLGSLFGTNLTMPCIDLSSLLGSTLFNVLDILISGFMIYNIGKKLIKIFNDFTNLKSNQIDELYGGVK